VLNTKKFYNYKMGACGVFRLIVFLPTIPPGVFRQTGFHLKFPMQVLDGKFLSI